MIGIFNAALVAQGLQEITSESDGLAEFRVLSRNWPAIIEAELEDGAYHFARREIEVASGGDGKFGFGQAFPIPSDAIHVRKVWDPKNPRQDFDYVQDGTHVHVSHAGPVTLQYVEVADPGLWSANFALGVQYQLEAVILRALKEEPAEAAQMEAQAQERFQRARTNSTRARSATKPHRMGRIAEARFGGRTPDSWQRRAGPAPSYPPSEPDPTPTDGTPHNFIQDYEQGKV